MFSPSCWFIPNFSLMLIHSRKMFPKLEYVIEGLKTNQAYGLVLQVEQVDDNRSVKIFYCLVVFQGGVLLRYSTPGLTVICYIDYLLSIKHLQQAHI